MGSKPDPEKTKKRGADTGPGLIAKWHRKAKIGQRQDPGIAGMGKMSKRCWHWIVFMAETWILAPEDVKTKFTCVITLGEICRGLSGTRLDLHKKVKNATKNKAHVAACNGIEQSNKLNTACKIEGVIADLQETACPKKCLPVVDRPAVGEKINHNIVIIREQCSPVHV